VPELTRASEPQPEPVTAEAIRFAWALPARACQGCDLHERATQTVFGHGATAG
jgi:uracil-DNA glycosylase